MNTAITAAPRTHIVNFYIRPSSDHSCDAFFIVVCVIIWVFVRDYVEFIARNALNQLIVSNEKLLCVVGTL